MNVWTLCRYQLLHLLLQTVVSGSLSFQCSASLSINNTQIFVRVHYQGSLMHSPLISVTVVKFVVGGLLEFALLIFQFCLCLGSQEYNIGSQLKSPRYILIDEKHFNPKALQVMEHQFAYMSFSRTVDVKVLEIFVQHEHFERIYQSVMCCKSDYKQQSCREI